MANCMSRSPFASQRLVYVILHYTIDSIEKTGMKIIYESFRELLAVSAGTTGVPRIPGIGCGILDRPFHQILPMTPVKGSLDQILQKVDKLATLEVTDAGEDPAALLNEALPYVIQSVNDFMPNTLPKLKLVILAWDKADEIMRGVSTFVEAEQPLCLTSVKVLQIQSPQEQSVSPKLLPEPIDTSTGIQIIGEDVPLDPFSIRLLFKELLVEIPGKQPHAILTFKPDEAKKAIYLDAQETAIEPMLLPWGVASKTQLTMHNIRTTTSISGSNVSVWELEALNTIQKDSFNFLWQSGVPIYLIPSAAENLSFDDFWTNSQRANALSERLEARQIGILCRHSAKCNPQVMAHCVIFSFNKVLSLIQIVPPELTLAQKLSATFSAPQNKFRDQIDSVLNGLGETTDLRIEQLKSCLVPAIVNHFTKNQRGASTSNRNTPIGAGNPISSAIRAVRPQLRRGGFSASNQKKSGPSDEAQHPCFVPRRSNLNKW